MTPEQLAAIAHRIKTPSTGYHAAYRDRVALLAHVADLRAVIAAADALHSCAAGEHLKREAAWDAYRVARKQLEGM